MSQTKVLRNLEGERSLEEVLEDDVANLTASVEALNTLEDEGTELNADQMQQIQILGPELEAKEKLLAKTRTTISALQKSAALKKLHAREYDASTPRPAAARAGVPELGDSVVVAQPEAETTK